MRQIDEMSGEQIETLKLKGMLPMTKTETASETPEDSRKTALAKFLSVDAENITETDFDNGFEFDGEEYLVLTDEEADEAAYDYIKESVWAFNSSFLASFTGLPEEMFKAVQDKCEGGNDAILQCIENTDEGLDGFVADAISADGRGHFVSQYDGEENEEGDYYIYRTN